MKGTISLESLWQTIQSLSMNNQKWLSDKLIENIREHEDDKYISKEDILAGIDAGIKDLKEGDSISAEDFLKELRDESFN